MKYLAAAKTVSDHNPEYSEEQRDLATVEHIVRAILESLTSEQLAKILDRVK
jgi:hypothetical protein